jgi:hypothetical protein
MSRAAHAPQQLLQLLAAGSTARATGEAVALIAGERRAAVLAHLGALVADRRRSY